MTVEDTWERGTTNDEMVGRYYNKPPPPSKFIQLNKDGDAEPVTKTWVRATTNSAMVPEAPYPKPLPEGSIQPKRE